MQKLTYSAVLGTLTEEGFKPLAIRAGISKQSMELVGDWKNGRRPRFRRLCVDEKTQNLVLHKPEMGVSGVRLTDNFALFTWDSIDFEKRWDSIMREAAKQDRRHV